MSYKYWKKFTEDSKQIIYQTKDGELVEDSPDWQTIQRVRAFVRQSRDTTQKEYTTGMVIVDTDKETGDIHEVHEQRTISDGYTNKSEAKSDLTDILEDATYNLAIGFIEEKYSKRELKRPFNITKIESHYAPEQVTCPDCGIKGQMTYNDATTSFRCNACGSTFNHEDEEIPDKVETNR